MFSAWEQEFDCIALYGITAVGLIASPVLLSSIALNHIFYFFKDSVTIFIENKCISMHICISGVITDVVNLSHISY